jgi:hypothetical protein
MEKTLAGGLFGGTSGDALTLQFLARRRIILPPSIITVGVLVQILTKSLTIIMDRREYFFFYSKNYSKNFSSNSPRNYGENYELQNRQTACRKKKYQ